MFPLARSCWTATAISFFVSEQIRTKGSNFPATLSLHYRFDMNSRNGLVESRVRFVYGLLDVGIKGAKRSMNFFARCQRDASSRVLDA